MSRKSSKDYQSANTAIIESKELLQVLERTNKANPKAEDVAALKEALRANPGLWRQIGDLARTAQGELVDQLSTTALARETYLHALEELRQGLGYEAAPVLERLLIEEVALMWLHYYKTQRAYVRATQDSIPIVQGDFWERKVNAAQRRYLRAVEALGRVRKLTGRGALQINIAGQQVNVAG